MDLIDLDRRALAVFRGHLAATPRSRLGDPTPCPDWDARALVDHVVGGNELFAAAVRGDGPDWSRRHDGRVGDDPLAAWDPSAAAITAALAVADPDAPAELPFGTLTAGRAAAIHFVDVLVHAWDLAVATGRDGTLPADLATAALDVVATYAPEVWGRPQFFAGKLPAPPGAPPHVRLVTTLGRRADWRPGAA